MPVLDPWGRPPGLPAASPACVKNCLSSLERKIASPDERCQQSRDRKGAVAEAARFPKRFPISAKFEREPYSSWFESLLPRDFQSPNLKIYISF